MVASNDLNAGRKAIAMKTAPLSKNGSILVAGAPARFDLCASIRRASTIWIASAFAHQSGWRMIRESVLQSHAEIYLLSGLDFCQTEPAVLRDWISKDFVRKHARAYLYSGPETFHPKVFVIHGPRTSFALVGSGNLSAGGLRGNVECFAYVGVKQHVSQVIAWLAHLTNDSDRCITLTADVIKTYEPKWKRAFQFKRKVQEEAEDASAMIAQVHHAQLEQWRRAVREAKRYFRSDEFTAHASQRKAARDILHLLHHPSYNFSKEEWSGFYDIWNMGHLIPIYKYRVYRQKGKLVAGLRMLADRSLPVHLRVDNILDRRRSSHVKYFGINAVSKILASLEPKRWPVWNKPVKEALAEFGYRSPRGASPGQKYAAFADIMARFMSDVGAKDMLALDCFFIWKYHAVTDR